MIAVISVLLVLTISMIVMRVSSVALVHTGMGRGRTSKTPTLPTPAARFHSTGLVSSSA